MVKHKKFFWIMGVILLIIVIAVLMSLNKGGNNEQLKTVKVERKDIIYKALAVGSIEPLNEISIKSKMSGVVGKIYADVGDYVNKNDPLLEVKPNPTPLELVQLEKEVERQSIKFQTLKKQLRRNEELKKKNLISDYDFDICKENFSASQLNYNEAKERLDLLEKGKVKIADKMFENIIKAPITGSILEKLVNEGDPIVPLTSYQPGTEIMSMADMNKLLFRGTVDEIDVGKIKEGLRAKLEIGALPGTDVEGFISLLSLKARKDENRTVFPIEIEIDNIGDAVLRAGFSANAHIIIEKKDSVLAIPERVVVFRNDSAFVRVLASEEKVEEKYIETGLSDAIYIEVLSGLKESDKVLEKEIKEIE